MSMFYSTISDHACVCPVCRGMGKWEYARGGMYETPCGCSWCDSIGFDPIPWSELFRYRRKSDSA